MIKDFVNLALYDYVKKNSNKNIDSAIANCEKKLKAVYAELTIALDDLEKSIEKAKGML